MADVTFVKIIEQRWNNENAAAKSLHEKMFGQFLAKNCLQQNDLLVLILWNI